MMRRRQPDPSPDRPRTRSARSTAPRPRRPTAILVWLALAPFATGSAPPAFAAWKTFTVADGLASNFVRHVLVDRGGQLWITTDGAGVCMHDGKRWRNYTKETTAGGLASNIAERILEDRSGNLWFTTVGGGVSRFDGTSWRAFTQENDGLASNTSWPILEDRAGNLWVGTALGACRFDGTTWTTQLAGYHILSMMQDREGMLWFGTFDHGVFATDSTGTDIWAQIGVGQGLTNPHVYSICEDRSGDLWFGTKNGLFRYDGVSVSRRFSTADGLASNWVFDVLEDGSGTIWAATFNTGAATPGAPSPGDGGVSRYDGTAWRSYTPATGNVGDRVVSVSRDLDGNLWFGSYSGATRHDGAEWRTFTIADGLPSNDVRQVFEDHNGARWFATSGGATRVDGTGWRTFTRLDWGTVGSDVYSILEDRHDNLWLGTNGSGAIRFDGAAWTVFRAPKGPCANNAFSITEDEEGALWFCPFGADSCGATRFDDAGWRRFTTADGLGSNGVIRVTQDRSGDHWFATTGGATRCDADTCVTLTPESTDGGLVGNDVHCILEDDSGSFWFACANGLSRYDGSAWRTFGAADGLPDGHLPHILQDSRGHIWTTTWSGGVAVYEGTRLWTFTATDGLANNFVYSTYEDHAGNLWFSTSGGGATRYTPDRVPPRTVFVTFPPDVSPARDQRAVFGAFGEGPGISYSYRLDGGIWTDWSPTNSWTGNQLPDGSHLLEVRARDFLGNVDETPVAVAFEVDATAPVPAIAAPAPGQAVSARVAVRGTAADARFRSYEVLVRRSGESSWDPPSATSIGQSSSPVENGILGTWDTAAVPDGLYEIRVSVMDSLGLVGIAQAAVVVDNQAPFVDETSPAKVTAASGGDVFTTNAEVHLYFPPRAFREDAVVVVTPLDRASVGDTLAGMALLADPGYELSWSGGALQKPARLEMSYGGIAGSSSAGLALYRGAEGATWERLGGTVDPGRKTIALAIDRPGRYALFTDAGVLPGRGTLSGLSFTPRVFSPTGAFADREVGIGFTLGRPAPVTVRVYARNGRLIRDVLLNAPMGAGANLVRWDGTDRNGGYVTDGIYLVTVEALGRTETKPLAVVK